MMATRAGSEQAITVLAEVQDAMVHSAPATRRASAPAPRARAAGAGTELAAAAEPEPRPASTALDYGVLHVDLKSEAPEGTITLWIDGKEEKRDRFEFYERAGFFRKRPAVPGTWPYDVSLWPGNHHVRVLLARPDQPGAVRDVEAAIQAGGLHTLAISLPATGTPAFELR